MEAVEGGRRWGACQETVQPADELKAACDAANGWLKVNLCHELWRSYPVDSTLPNYRTV